MTSTIREREITFRSMRFLIRSAFLGRERYADRSREVLDATLETSREWAEDLLAPHLHEG